MENTLNNFTTDHLTLVIISYEIYQTARFGEFNKSNIKLSRVQDSVYHMTRECLLAGSCFTLLYVPSSFAVILMGKRELVALLSLSSWCLVVVVWLFLAVQWVCLQFVIVVFPDHTHYF